LGCAHPFHERHGERSGRAPATSKAPVKRWGNGFPSREARAAWQLSDRWSLVPRGRVFSRDGASGGNAAVNSSGGGKADVRGGAAHHAVTVSCLWSQFSRSLLIRNFI
jgi:hypothetical protein